MNTPENPNPGDRPTSVIVDVNEFCRLLVSRKKLIRQDAPQQSLRGLLDVENGVRYLAAVDPLSARLPQRIF